MKDGERTDELFSLVNETLGVLKLQTWRFEVVTNTLRVPENQSHAFKIS